MAAHPTSIRPGLRLANDLNDALTTWSTSQRSVIGLAADFAEWMVTGAGSAAHWIAAVADIEVCTAREWIRVGRRLRVLRVIADLFDADALSYSKVRVLSRVATPGNEEQLAAIAVDVPAAALQRAIAAWEAAPGPAVRTTFEERPVNMYVSVRFCTIRTMSTVSVSQARATLPELLDRVMAGDEVTITRHGVPVAVVVRPDTVRARRADRALADAERLRDLVDQARATRLSEMPAIAADRADDLVRDVAASRRAR